MTKYDETNITSSYKFNKNAEKARAALNAPLNRFSVVLKNYVSILDDSSDDILYFFPLNDMNKAGKEIKEIVLEDLRTNWKKAGFTILEERCVIGNEFKLGFMAVLFRLKKV